MATVWAWRTFAGIWSMNDPDQTEWSHQVEFSDLKDLLQKLNALRPSIKGQITKLGIVAHGDDGGLVKIGPDLTADTAASMAADLQQLDGFWPFAPELANAPGAVNAANLNKKPTAAGPKGKDPRLTEYSWYAKWSLDGRIIKKSLKDQGVLTYSSQVVSGIKAVEAMIAAHLTSIVSVGIQNEALRSRISGLSKSLVAGKVKVMSAAELTKLAGTPHHQGVVGVWDKQLTLNKCADPHCPGHANSVDFCEAFANQFPNGPLR